MERPVIGITMGDPAGIGPEIVVKSLANGKIYDVCKPLIIGDAGCVRKSAAIFKMDYGVNVVKDPSEGVYRHGTIDVLDLANVDHGGLKMGQIQAMAGKASFEYIEKSIHLALDRKIAAVATSPINKESIKAAGVPFIGHTEMYGDLTGTADPLTMFQVHGMRIFFLTRHVSLARAVQLITKERLLDYIKRCTEALVVLGVKDPLLAVAGLNPHSGEHGLFGDEEVREIEPAVAEAKARGFKIVGPVPADSVFHLAKNGRYDAVLSLYHDQGHIASKTLDFERTVSVTCGLPFLRSSVDHGTAFDIAGKGIASSVSMEEAILVAAEYAGRMNFVG
ncbi:MAG TPA: 4-hydroxythreonine-4-phosphate dehydrogenase PdxA [Bacillota bacterium]|nr:4-hydroxythreonine-4-phosphate dehydrogenase PdxA [Bacillota bacterium]HOA15785.1 4-hydroxythreonine-4-phosphate dehydrogenase PdxA [Bacillota bacterium]HOG53217.1 4-hydroxythreonine-4-phosphate dehydrogenase PdxA [Bacillota bacterium]